MSIDSIQKACMADLGRQRQDELPLSNKERKGPSFAPSRRNGTGHIAPDLKKGLEIKWRNVQINDEESEQMRGLAVEDSRPWAKKIAQDFINRNQIFTAPPKIRQESKGYKRVKENSLQMNPVASFGGLIPPGGTVRHFSASKSTGTLPSKTQARSIGDNGPSSTTSNTKDDESQILRSTPNSTMAYPAPSPAAPAEKPRGSPEPVTMSLPIRLSKPQDLEHIVLRGICKLLNSKDRSVFCVISYTMKVRKDRDEGYLILSRADKEDRVHNVLELMAPDTREDCCHVCPRDEKSGFTYILQFPNIPDAHKFKIYLESLQQAAAREANMERNKPNLSTTSVQGARETPISPHTTYPVIDSPSLSATSERTEPLRPAVSTLPSTVPTPAKQQCAERGGAGSVKLIDFDTPSCPIPASREYIIEDAAEKLVELIDTILPEAAEAGLNLSDDTIAHIEETAINDWLVRGFLGSETDDMKTDLLELLRILVRIKRKAESRRQTQPVIRSLRGFEVKSSSNRITYSTSQLELVNTTQHQQCLQDLDREPSPNRIHYDAAELETVNTKHHQAPSRSKCIKYTASELESMGSVRVVPPAALDTNITTPHRTLKSTSSPAAAVVNISKYKDWLGEKPGEVVDSLKSAAEASSAQSLPRAHNSATASHKNQSSPGGLGTSR